MAGNACPIWGTPATPTLTSGGTTEVDSSRTGGEYLITGTAESVLNSLDDQGKLRLTDWLVDQRQSGNKCPKISSDVLEKVQTFNPPTMLERTYGLLRGLKESSELLGDVTSIHIPKNAKSEHKLYTLLAYTSSFIATEVITLAEYCEIEGFVKYKVFYSSPQRHELMLLPPGYKKLQDLDGANKESDAAFVAMWFDKSMDDVYKYGIEAGIEDAGYKAKRIDNAEHNNKIDDEIIAAIRRSRFVVADFIQGDSGARGGVYYEAGFAHGLNIPVIFCCRHDSLKEVHFDTRQYSHIVWHDHDDLKQRLSQRISATIGDGPHKRKN